MGFSFASSLSEKSYAAVNTSIRLASIIPTIHSSPSQMKFLNIAFTARICNVERPMSGTPRLNASPFAKDNPIRSPVYEPGPRLTATASSFSPFLLSSAMHLSANGASFTAWFIPSVSSNSNSIAPSFVRATLHVFDDVSMLRIIAIYFVVF